MNRDHRAGMDPSQLKRALKGKPDANHIGYRMIIENNPNAYKPGTRRKRKRK